MELSVQKFTKTSNAFGELRYEFSQGDNFIGVASISIEETSYVIDFLTVMPDNRGKGYGSKMLEFLCQNLNDKPIALELDRGSPFGFDNLLSWYGRYGFIPTSGNWMVLQPHTSSSQ
jgi:GNAT superfamily N-acetyltransferase